MKRQSGSEPGGSQSGCSTRSQTFGKGDDPGGGHPGETGEASVSSHTEVVAVDDDLGTNSHRGGVRRGHRANKIHARDEW
jgi:hypothetical protein